MTEIGDKALAEGLNEPTRHEVIDARLDTLEKGLTKTATLAVGNSKLIERLSHNQTELFKLMERCFGTSDGI